MYLAYSSAQLLCMPLGVIAIVAGGVLPVSVCRKPCAVASEEAFSFAGPLLT